MCGGGRMPPTISMRIFVCRDERKQRFEKKPSINNATTFCQKNILAQKF
jgi:hypothetical protein